MKITGRRFWAISILVSISAFAPSWGAGWDLKGGGWAPGQPSTNAPVSPADKAVVTEPLPAPISPAPTVQERKEPATSPAAQQVETTPASGPVADEPSFGDRTSAYGKELWDRMAGKWKESSAPETVEDVEEAFGKAWAEAQGRISKILELEDEKRTLPEKAIFSKDQGDVDERISNLLDDVVQALQISGLTESRAAYVELDRRIREAEQEIIQWEEKRISAPKQSSRSKPFSKSQSECEAEIRTLNKQIETHRSKQNELISAMQKEYERLGINLSRDQVAFYLSAASGRDIVGLSAIFQNVKDLNAQLEGLMREGSGGAGAQRRYYGVHVILIQALVHAHDMVIERIDGRYLPKLAEIAEENRKVQERTRELAGRTTDPAHVAALAANQRAQENTSQAIELYKEHLAGLKQRMQTSREGVYQRYLVSKNTYDTIVVASALITEMESCVQDLMALKGMHLPDMVPFDDGAVREKFAEIGALLGEQ